MLFTLGQRTRLDLAVQRERSPLYVQLSDGAIRNDYTLKLRNMELRPRRVEVAIDGLPGARLWIDGGSRETRSEEHTSELQSLMRISYAVFCLKKKKPTSTEIIN